MPRCLVLVSLAGSYTEHYALESQTLTPPRHFYTKLFPVRNQTNCHMNTVGNVRYCSSFSYHTPRFQHLEQTVSPRHSRWWVKNLVIFLVVVILLKHVAPRAKWRCQRLDASSLRSEEGVADESIEVCSSQSRLNYPIRSSNITHQSVLRFDYTANTTVSLSTPFDHRVLPKGSNPI